MSHARFERFAELMVQTVSHFVFRSFLCIGFQSLALTSLLSQGAGRGAL
jgi:hypothetical protein